MSTVYNLDAARAAKEATTSSQIPGLRGSGGGGTVDGMETRVVKLEVALDGLQRDVTDLRTDMKDVRDRLTRVELGISHLPSKGFVVSTLLVALAVLGGIVTFQDTVQTLFGVG